MSSATTFSPREMELLALAWQCMETVPKIDIQKLAALSGYTPGSASVTLGKLKKKLKDMPPTTGARTPISTPKKASAPNSTKRGAAAADGESPTKKKRGASAKKTRPQEQQYGAEEDFEQGFADVKVKPEPEDRFLHGLSTYGDNEYSEFYDDNNGSL